MINLILILVLLLNLRLLGLSRLGACIRTVAVQGILLGLLPLAETDRVATLRVLALCLGSMLIKGIIFPKLLFRALREANVTREIQPFIGYLPSLLLGVLGLMLSFWLGHRLPLPFAPGAALLVPVSFFSILVGLFLIITRKRAINQVLGFIALENGIYMFGVGVLEEASLLVELGVLLDVFVAVFVMGIAIFHISREFDHIETDQLSELKD